MTAKATTNLDDFFMRFNQRLMNPTTPDEQADLNECIEERAAIMEYDAGLPRQEAELQARVICLTEYRNKRGFKAG